MNVNTLTRFLFLSFILFIIFTACHKKKKPFLLLPLMDNASVSGGSGGSGPIFIPARGEIDSSFASNGIFLKDFNSGSSSDAESVNAILVQPDGKILLGGSCGDNGFANANFCIARLNSDGTLDTSFGSGGYVIQDIPTSDEDNGYSLALQPDGKILLGGSCRISGAYQFCIARFNSDGSLDTTSFGSPNGYVIQDVGTNDDYGYSLALQPDGKILMMGNCINSSNYAEFCIARFNSNGQLDTSFASPNGYMMLSITGDDYSNAIAVQPDGRILIGGQCYQSSDESDFCVARIQ
jgi:uncharacterized delta-60 repeat protein